jgi:hypothetical protein
MIARLNKKQVSWWNFNSLYLAIKIFCTEILKSLSVASDVFSLVLKSSTPSQFSYFSFFTTSSFFSLSLLSFSALVKFSSPIEIHLSS